MRRLLREMPIAALTPTVVWGMWGSNIMIKRKGGGEARQDEMHSSEFHQS